MAAAPAPGGARPRAVANVGSINVRGIEDCRKGALKGPFRAPKGALRAPKGALKGPFRAPFFTPPSGYSQPA